MILSPLRYPGGKSKMAPYFAEIFRRNDLCGGRYIEPYAGGASVALSLLMDHYVSEVVINDRDRSLYAFWYSAFFDTDRLCNLILDAKLEIPEWEKQRQVQKRKSTANLLKLGFSTFYLNRTNRSGILNGGVIGGKDQTGEWKLDARFNPEELIQRIKRLAEYEHRVSVYNLDALELLKAVGRPAKKELIYFDPPYYHKGQKLYLNAYRPQDHQRVAKTIKKLKTNWVISYDNVPEIRKLYSDCRKRVISLQYNAGPVRKADEVVFFSDEIQIPRISG